jgi:hypothetical protein
MTYQFLHCYVGKAYRDSLADNFFFSTLYQSFKFIRSKEGPGFLDQLRKIRVQDSAPDPEHARDSEQASDPDQAPDPEQALDPELAQEEPRFLGHLRKIKVPDPPPELAPAPGLAPDTELVPDPTLDPIIILLGT